MTSVAVIGLGYVGLPLAVEFGKRFDTIGYDLSARKVDALRDGVDATGEVSREEIESARRLRVTTDATEMIGADVFVIALDDPARPVTRCVGSEAHETQPAISPNGRWLAYTSSASGRDEIYVEGFPEPGLRVPISAHGGRAARWNAEGTRLVFRRGPAVISVAVETRAGRLHVGPEEHRFDLHDVDDPGRRTFDLDGDALLTVRHRVDAPNADRLRVVVGWTAEPAR